MFAVTHDTTAPAAVPLPNALLNTALTAVARKDLHTALALAEQILQAEPNCARAHHLLGLVALSLGEMSRAIERFEEAHRLAPAAHEHAEMLAILYAKAGMLNDSLYYGKVATVLPPDPDHALLVPQDIGNFCDNLLSIREQPLAADASLAVSRGDYHRAIQLFEQAIDLDPETIEAWRGLAHAALASGALYKSLSAFLSLRQIALDDPADLVGLAHCLAQLGRFADSQTCHEAAPLRAEYCAAAIQDALLAPDAAPQTVVQATIRWAGLVKPSRALQPADPRPLAERLLRIGVVGSGFRDGVEYEPLMRLLAALDPQRCQLYVYSANPYEDQRTRRFRNSITRWTNIARTDDDTAALLIRNDAPDLLMDMDGFRPHGRPGLFLRRPARVQASWLGLPEQARACGFDWVIGDAWTHPEDQDRDSGAHAPVLRLMGGLFEVPDTLATRRPPEDGQLIFGTLASRAQFSLKMVALWARALRRLPTARLLIDPQYLGGTEGLREITCQFAYFGVADRLQTATSTTGELSLETFMQAIDVLLEPVGCDRQAATTAAIAAGIPVIAHMGVFPRQRALASLLRFAGRAGTVATNEAEYEAMMIEAASPGLVAPPVMQPHTAIDLAMALETACRNILP